MASPLYADEDFDRRVVEELRRLGVDILTAQDAGKSNQGIADSEVLAFAGSLDRPVLTFNRRDFIRLHRIMPEHAGIIVCTRDVDFVALAARILRGPHGGFRSQVPPDPDQSALRSREAPQASKESTSRSPSNPANGPLSYGF